MTKYFDFISRSHADSTPDVVFEKLLKLYFNEATTLFFTRRHHQFLAAKLLKLITDFRQRNSNNDHLEVLWKSIASYLNNNLPLHRLDKKGDFALLLNTFLSFYPNLTALLSKDLSLHLSSSPYLFSTTKEINQLLNHLCSDKDNNGIVSKSFASLILKAPSAFRKDLLVRLPGILANAPLPNKLQIVKALIDVHASIPAPIIQEIISILIAPVQMTPAETQTLTYIFAACARQLHPPVQRIFIGYYLQNKINKISSFKIMLAHLKSALPFLAKENIAPLIPIFLKLTKDYKEDLAAPLCEALSIINTAHPDFMAEKIKAYMTSQEWYERDVFHIFDKLTINYSAAQRVAAIAYLDQIYHLKDFAPPHSTFWYTSQYLNRDACLRSIKKLFNPLDERTKIEVIESLDKIQASLEYYKFLCELIDKRQISTLQTIVNGLVASMEGEFHTYAIESKLSKLLMLAFNNKQNDIVTDFLGKFDPNNETLNFSILRIIEQHLYVHIDEVMKNLFFEKVQLLFRTLTLPDQYKFIERLGFTTESEIVTRYAEEIKPTFRFDLDLVAKLTIKGRTFLQLILNPAQHKMVLNWLYNSYPKNKSDDDYPKILAEYLYSMSLYASHLTYAAQVSILKKLIKDGTIIDNHRGFRIDKHFANAVGNCVNAALETDATEVINLIMPFLLIEDTYIQDGDFPFEIINTLTDNAQQIITQQLLEKIAATDKLIVKRHIFYLLIKLLGLIPQDISLYKQVINKLITEAPRMKLNYKLARTFTDLLHALPPTSIYLVDILFAIFIHEPNILDTYSLNHLINLVIASNDAQLIKSVIRKNINNLYRLPSCSEGLQNLQAFTAYLSIDHQEQIAEILQAHFEDDAIIQSIDSIETRPHHLDYSLLLRDHTTGQLFVSPFLDFIPGLALGIINKLMAKDNLGSQRILNRLHKGHVKQFDEFALVHLKVWLISSDPAIKSDSLDMLKKILKVMEIKVSVVAEAVKDVADATKQIIILQLAHYMKNDTPPIQAFAKKAMFDLFYLWDNPVKEIIMTKLMDMVLRKSFVNTNNLHKSFMRLTQEIVVLKNAEHLKLILNDCYSTKLMSSPSLQYDDGRKLLLYMISTLKYAAIVRPLLLKKTQNQDLTNHIMRFLI
jgi:hypothetical protein